MARNKSSSPPIKAIRAFCIECMGGDRRAVRECPSAHCPLFSFREGFNSERVPTPLEIEKGRKLAEKAKASKA